jgi:hypothetical protein
VRCRKNGLDPDREGPLSGLRSSQARRCNVTAELSLGLTTLVY